MVLADGGRSPTPILEHGGRSPLAEKNHPGCSPQRASAFTPVKSPRPAGGILAVSSPFCGGAAGARSPVLSWRSNTSPLATSPMPWPATAAMLLPSGSENENPGQHSLRRGNSGSLHKAAEKQKQNGGGAAADVVVVGLDLVAAAPQATHASTHAALGPDASSAVTPSLPLPACDDDTLGSRLAAFASGCLGTTTHQKAGQKLGLMGGVTEEEMGNLLQYLELLTKNRAAKLMGVNPVSDADLGAGLSSSFEAALIKACGLCRRGASEPPGTTSEQPQQSFAVVAELCARLPRDPGGHVDLLRAFGMAPAGGSSKTLPARRENLQRGAAEGPAGSPPVCDGAARSARSADDTHCSSEEALVPSCMDSVDFTSEYTEHASSLPSLREDAAGVELLRSAERRLLPPPSETLEATNWEADASAINVLRAVLAHGMPPSPDDDPRARIVLGTAAQLAAIAGRCGSRRPALAKAALHALAEFAEPGCAAPENAWSEAPEAVFAGCLSGLKVTKMVARVAEEALLAVTRRVAAEASPILAASALARVVATGVCSKPCQPPMVLAGLKALLPLAPGLACVPGWSNEEDARAVSASLAELAQEVLACRSLGAAYADARKLLKALPVVQASSGAPEATAA